VASTHQVAQSGKLLTAAFWHDPWFATLADEKRREKVLGTLFRALVRYAIDFGRVETMPDRSGLACWLLPGHPHFGTLGLVRRGIWPLPFQLGHRGFRRFMRYSNHVAALHHRWQPGPHWYLALLAVALDQQGRGVGSRLIESTLRLADQRGEPCYLETQNPRNVPLYQRHGFKVLEESATPEAGIHVWAMRREARR